MDFTTIRDARWPDGLQSNVTRLQQAMIPPTGTIGLSFMGMLIPREQNHKKPFESSSFTIKAD